MGEAKASSIRQGTGTAQHARYAPGRSLSPLDRGTVRVRTRLKKLHIFYFCKSVCLVKLNCLSTVCSVSENKFGLGRSDPRSIQGTGDTYRIGRYVSDRAVSYRSVSGVGVYRIVSDWLIYTDTDRIVSKKMVSCFFVKNSFFVPRDPIKTHISASLVLFFRQKTR